MYEDALKAVEIEPFYFKAHLRLGESLVELGKLPKYSSLDLIDRGIKSISKALSLCWNMTTSDPRFKDKSAFEREINK